jgi:hypothetical protein
MARADFSGVLICIISYSLLQRFIFLIWDSGAACMKGKLGVTAKGVGTHLTLPAFALTYAYASVLKHGQLDLISTDLR